MPLPKKETALERARATLCAALAPRNGGSTFNAKTECFTVQTLNERGAPKTVRLKGLVPALRDALYPNFEFTRPAKGGTERAPIVGSKPLKKKGTVRAGLARGKAVDATIAKCIKTGNFKPSCRATRHVFAALFKMGLTPVLTQAPVHGMPKGIRVGTAVDVVCLNTAFQPVLVEIKTGYSNTWDGSNASLCAPLVGIPNSPRHQHMLQLGATCELFTMTTGMRPADAFVMRVIASGVEYTRVRPEIQRAMPAILAMLGRTHHE